MEKLPVFNIKFNRVSLEVCPLINPISSKSKANDDTQQGFTLVELMVALAMSGIIIAAVYAAYTLQQKTYFAQSQVVEMQQNIRASLEMMTRDIRMAAYDPGGDANADIPVATSGRLQVRMDLNNDGDYADPDEDITFAISDDADGNGISDSGSGNLGRNGQSIAENIHAVEFYYRAVDDKFAATTAPTPAQRADIQSVQISLLAVSEQRDAKFTNNQTYRTASGNIWGPYNDSFRRRILVHTVNIRNQGL